MLFEPTLLLAAMFAGQASAAFVYCSGAPIYGQCLPEQGTQANCENIEGNCRPNCFKDDTQKKIKIGATCCNKDGTIHVYCFREN
ncbi:hypothetical protein HYFRA_00001437 [Hymenoscyphus fraxineus]|uniref:Secreted protein n=1 Tax=Hymenoscyphus fraxineus TaxID=746836 RepID=A0A9N9L6P7_9HELO|nr:hypothetical protein HYFRA_00001437 [Hymenoscyphus fraxineus]